MEWCIEKSETVEQEIIDDDGKKRCVLRDVSTEITVGTIEEAKRKAEEWGLSEDESIGTWFGREDSLWAAISTSDPKIKSSVLHIFIDPGIITQHTWKKGLIVRDDHGKKVTNQMMLTDVTTGIEIIRHVEIKNGKVIKKPRCIDILGEKTDKGFALRGITLKNIYSQENC